MYLAFNHRLIVFLYTCICPFNTSCPLVGSIDATSQFRIGINSFLYFFIQCRIGLTKFCIKMIIGIHKFLIDTRNFIGIRLCLCIQSIQIFAYRFCTI